MQDEVRERARTYFDGVSPAHDWHHVRRVARLAETLVEADDDEASASDGASESDAAGDGSDVDEDGSDVDEDGSGVDEDVLLAAVWLHDVGRAKEDRGEIEDHAEWGAEEAAEILRDLGADAETVEAVQHCVRAHRYSNDVDPETREAKLLSDADNLDALGAVGIARVFAYGGELGQPLYDPDLPPEADDSAAGETQFNHVHEKILDLPDRMYTDAGRELARERGEYVAAFAERFEREAMGER
ncbi:HD domain-containing protein [Halorussus gelatinilyticus]|uniref:HD domain-containing protein n=1 Tax=Halorussus gelatinilyticus TaxID=2937524 RepID=A0A8U0ILR2_9EURY|nr:HD domain-containing protein [Halorussus gelatinilyticus]UPW01595.1 HD domain-containing protein [Halorussus gelatinilyticus]